MSDKPKLLLGTPSYNRNPDFAAMRALYQQSNSEHVTVELGGKFSGAAYPGGGVYVASLLAHAFNMLWMEALMGDYDYFLMLHGDVQPEPKYIDKMLTEMWKHKADVVSAVIPIKNPLGVTSTAIGNPKTPWVPIRRLTMKEIHKLPVTFDAEAVGYPGYPLLLNTGLLLVDITGDWIGETNEDGSLKMYFTINDRILKGKTKLRLQAESEDWFFSRRAWELGAKLVATRAVSLRHHGTAFYSNSVPWGAWETDKKAKIANEEEEIEGLSEEIIRG